LFAVPAAQVFPLSSTTLEVKPFQRATIVHDKDVGEMVGAFVGPAVDIGTHMRCAHAYDGSPVMWPAQMYLPLLPLHAAIATWYGGHITTDELATFVALMVTLSLSGVASSPTLSSAMTVMDTSLYTEFAVHNGLSSTVATETESTVSPALSAVHFAPP
jgi:hypothetical protein